MVKKSEVTTTQNLTTLCAEIVEISNKTDTNAIRSAWNLSTKIVDAKNNPQKYGADAVQRICDYMQWEKRNVAFYIRIGETFTEQEVQILMDKRFKNKRGLTYSHMAELSRIPTARERSTTLNRCIKESMNAHTLRSYINGLLTDGDEEMIEAKAVNPFSLIKEGADTGHKFVERLAQLRGLEVDEEHIARASERNLVALQELLSEFAIIKEEMSKVSPRIEAIAGDLQKSFSAQSDAPKAVKEKAPKASAEEKLKSSKPAKKDKANPTSEAKSGKSKSGKKKKKKTNSLAVAGVDVL